MPTVAITVEGLGDITDDVIYESATFTSQANGAPGTAMLRIKDVGHDYEVITGKRLHLDIDGQRAWTGYVMQVSRVYALPVVPTGPQWARLVQINAADINILFVKRIVFNQADPTDIETPLYPPGPPIRRRSTALFDDWLDLRWRRPRYHTMIENVADINLDQEGRAWSAGWTVGPGDGSIAMLPGAVYYIDPDRRVVWTDVDTPNAPWELSDRPTGAQVGYRSMELLKDGSRLINDFLAIGMGMARATPVPAARSVARASPLTGGGRTATSTPVSSSRRPLTESPSRSCIGSPSNNRGAKDDRVSVGLTIFVPGFRVGMKAVFESEVFGFTDVIPIRQQTITFVSPDRSALPDGPVPRDRSSDGASSTPSGQTPAIAGSRTTRSQAAEETAQEAAEETGLPGLPHFIGDTGDKR